MVFLNIEQTVYIMLRCFKYNIFKLYIHIFLFGHVLLVLIVFYICVHYFTKQSLIT